MNGLGDRWMREALCVAHAEVDFYARPGPELERALAVCAGCPVRTRCLEHAIVNGEGDGVWGGVTGQARRRMRLAAVA